jgi:hypothetical protein
MLQSALCGAAALLPMTLTAQSASAWTWSPVTVVYSNVSYCVKAQAGIDHFTPGTFSGNLAYANGYLLARAPLIGGGPCDRAMTGEGRVRLVVQRWNDWDAWIFCRGSGWSYGQFGWSGGDLGGPYGPQQTLDYGGSASCGPGYYRTVATAERFLGGSTWVGGSVASGYEFVP